MSIYGLPKRWILPEKPILLEPSDAVLCREGLLGGNPDGNILQRFSCRLCRHAHSEKVCAGKKVHGLFPTKNGVVSGAKRARYGCEENVFERGISIERTRPNPHSPPQTTSLPMTVQAASSRRKTKRSNEMRAPPARRGKDGPTPHCATGGRYAAEDALRALRASMLNESPGNELSYGE